MDWVLVSDLTATAVVAIASGIMCLDHGDGGSDD